MVAIYLLALVVLVAGALRSSAAAAAPRFRDAGAARPLASRPITACSPRPRLVIPMLALARSSGARSRRALSRISPLRRCRPTCSPPTSSPGRSRCATSSLSPTDGIGHAQPSRPYARRRDLRLLAHRRSVGPSRCSASLSALAAACLGVLSRSLRCYRARNRFETVVRVVLIACSAVAILTTVGIVFSVLFETLRFFARYPFWDFLFGLQWSRRRPPSARIRSASRAPSARCRCSPARR